jgi:hypothetical protein
MSNADPAYNFERYRRLLAEANDEPKRLAFIDLLIQEKARDRLAEHMLHTKPSERGMHSDAPFAARGPAGGIASSDRR